MSDSDLMARAMLRIGTTLRGKYRLDRVLGLGSTAVVYAATHRNGKEFAVKMLHPELSVHSEIRMRFLREGYAANALKHPGAVTVLDDDVGEDGVAFLVMELLEGETVDAMWRRHGRKLDLKASLDIGCQVLDVLTAAHARGVVHRDIKPANLFLTTDGRLKALDFGIARLTDTAALAGGAATQTGMMVGTPAFMAPEQAQGRAAEVDGQTDVWAVGATLYALLSGRAVHEASCAQQILLRAATTPAPPLASFADHVPVAITRVVDRALAFDKAARWPSAAAMAEALRDAYTATFGTAQSPSEAQGSTSAHVGRTPMGASAKLSDAAPNDSKDSAMRWQPPFELGGLDVALPSAPGASSPQTPTRRAGISLTGRLIGVAAAVLVVTVIALEVRPSSAQRAGEDNTRAVETRVQTAIPTLSNDDLPAPSTMAPVSPSPPILTSAAPPALDPRGLRNAMSTLRAASASAAKAKTNSAGGRDCNPNFTFDSEGNKHFKPECF